MSTEIILSSDINIITAEINSYKQVAGQAIFEIGRRLKHVKENDLVHGEWMKWCQESLNFNSEQANKYIKVYERFSNYELTSNMSVDALYIVTSMSDEQIQQQHTIPSTGEQKTVDEMTVRELREVKAALKKAEEELEQERKAKVALLETVESMGESQVKEVIKEVIPENVKNDMENLKNRLQEEQYQSKQIEEKLLKLSIEKTEYEKKLRQVEEYQKSEQYEIDRMKKEKEKLELQAHISINTLQIGIHKFVEEYSPSVFLQGAVAASAGIIKDDLLDSVIALEEFTQKLREILDAKIDNRRIIEIN